MHGWRGRLGLLMPADNTVVEVELTSRLPRGVSTHVVRLSTGQRRDRMVREAPDVAPFFVEADVDVIAYAASSLLLGPDGNQRLIEDVSAAAGGLPAFTASTATTAALREVGATRLAVLSPHPPAIAEHLRSYLVADGFEVASLHALDLGSREVNSLRPHDVYRAVRQLDLLGVDLLGVDAVLVAATNLRTFEVVDALEIDVGLPVITSNQACLWAGLGHLGIAIGAAGPGRLLRA